MIKNYGWIFLWLFSFSVLSCTSSCSVGNESPMSGKSEDFRVSVVNWNVQTFFDAETDGNEYSEFLSNAKWSRDKYLERLLRLCETITVLGADVYVFEEIENEGILYDISNQLAGSSWDSKKIWSYGCFSRDEGSSIGCGILSRYPLLDVKSHSIDVRTQTGTQPSMRPLLEATIKMDEKALTIFACHWKSKSGGEDETEIWRDWQEYVVAEKLAGIQNPVLVCGDLNRDILDFAAPQSNQIVLRGSKNILVYSPWLLEDGSFSTETGSYYFDGKWERIDNFFLFGEGKITGFRVKAQEPWIKENGTPASFKIGSGEGYSDHLPIMCLVSF